MALTAAAACDTTIEVHDRDVLEWASEVLDRAGDPRAMQDEVVAAVKRNARWRGDECVNLLAPEAPMNPTVRHLLSAEVGQRAAEGHIGPANRWFAGTRYIDEIETLCVELLKRVFRARYADLRLVASMISIASPVRRETRPVRRRAIRNREPYDPSSSLGTSRTAGSPNRA
jgi:glycine hydroxymethyltransferase